MKQKFLNELYKKLIFLSPTEKKKVVNKYKEKIAKQKNNKGKKNKEIIVSYNIDKIVKKEFLKKQIKEKKYGLLVIKDIISYIPILLKNSYYRVFRLIKRDRAIKIEKDIEREISDTRVVKNNKVFVISGFPLILLIIILCFIFLTLLSITMCILFSIFDGLKAYALLAIFVSLSILCLQSIYLIERLLKKKIIRFRKEFKVFATCLTVIGLSIGFLIVQFGNLKYINDVNSKYTMVLDKKEININNLGKKYYLRFNSWYKPNYIIEYDDTLDDKLVIEIKYYECFYDVNFKKDQNSMYISLAENYRDKLSFYIENLKDNEIYSSKELSRYTILIKYSEKNKDRIVLEREL